MIKRLGTSVKIAVSAGLLLFILSRLDSSQLVNQVANAQRQWLLLGLGLYFAAILLGVLKWHLLVRVQHLPASYRDLAVFTFDGLFLGNVLPSNLGSDIVRAYGLARRAPGSAEAAFTSVVVDRLLGLTTFFGAALVNVGLAALLLTNAGQLEALEVMVVVAAALCVCGGVLFFSRRFAQRASFLFDLQPLARFKPRAARLYRAIQAFRFSPGALAANAALSACIIVVATLVWYSVARALYLDIPLLYFFLFNPLIAFVLMLPISLNGLGPKEATAIFFFGLVGVPSESAFAMSLLFHAIVVLTSLPGGILRLRKHTLPRSALLLDDKGKIE